MKEIGPECCERVMEGFPEEVMPALRLQGKQMSGGGKPALYALSWPRSLTMGLSPGCTLNHWRP